MVADKRLTCIIIDDEPLAQELLQKYIGRLSFLELTATFDDAVEALGQMASLRPDVILLDVNMPEMSGIDFLKTFTSFRPAVILTTAYSEYAIQGFEYDVTDFILKPVTFDRFVKAINRVRERTGPGVPAAAEAPATEAPTAQLLDAPDRQRVLLIKENKKFLRVAVEDVLFVEGMKDYLKLHTKSKVIVTHMTMTKMESMLSETDFLRVNRSYLVQKAAIKAINGNTIEVINNSEIPIGINYREAIRKMTDKGIL
jgi:DNA-binding LytR/AlgR family response regulator